MIYPSLYQENIITKDIWDVAAQSPWLPYGKITINQWVRIPSAFFWVPIQWIQGFSEALGDPSCVFGSRSSFFSSTIPSCAASRINLRCSPWCSGCHQNMGNLKQPVTWMESIWNLVLHDIFPSTEMESNHVLAVSFYLASGFPILSWNFLHFDVYLVWVKIGYQKISML